MERQLIINLITSTEFIQQVEPYWSIRLIESAAAKRIASWVMEYYAKYNKAPGKDIQPIFYDKSKPLLKDVSEDIEEILMSLSEESEQEKLNVEYAVDQFKKFFNEKNLIRHSEEVKALVQQGKIVEAEKHALSYKPLSKDTGNSSDLSDITVMEKIENAFNSNFEHLIKFEGALGQFWNDQLVRGGFVALMASEKRGKTFWLLEFAMRACKQGRKVAFFQAGDMTEAQQLIRMSIYLAKKSNKEKFCGTILEPVKDCIFNQVDQCRKPERCCDFGVFPKEPTKELRNTIDFEKLKDALSENKDYKPCADCAEFPLNKWGTPWLKEVVIDHPLTAKEAKKEFKKFFMENERRFKLSTHASGTLSVKQAKAIMDLWEKQDGFIPDVIIFDYPDIMTDETVNEHRHKQNKIWMDLRGLCQERHSLVIVVTQADADSYTKDLLKMDNFSEDKRKYAHPTAFYGLNQDRNGREKKIGIMRINEIVVREGDFDQNNQVYVLQNLKRGRPYLCSYW